MKLLRRRAGSVEAVACAADADETLLDVARAAGFPVASACAGDALCCRCGLEIRAGRDHLSDEDAEETRRKAMNRIPAEWRLACQARVRGPVTARAPYW